MECFEWNRHLLKQFCPPAVSGMDRGSVFEDFWRLGSVSLQALDGIDLSWLALDGTMTKAPLGGGKTGPNPTDRGKGGVKRSLLTEAHGIPVVDVNYPDRSATTILADGIGE